MTPASLLDMLTAVDARATAAEDRRIYQPHPKQKLFHESTARVRALFTGNRFGKTFATVHEAIWWAVGSHPHRLTPKPPVRIRYYVDGYEGTHYREVVLPMFRECCDPVTLSGGGWDMALSRRDRVIRFANESTVSFMSYRLTDYERSTQAYGGADVDLHLFDEHGALDIYRECGARLGVGRRPEIVVAYTPLIGKRAWEYSEIYQRWQRGEPGYDVVEGTIWDNVLLSPEHVGEYLDSLPPEQRPVRESGAWIDVGGAVYPMFQREHHVVAFDRERVAAATKTLVIDPHPSRTKGHHLLWCGVSPDRRMFCYREAVLRVPIPEIADTIRRVSAEDSALREDIRRFLIDAHWGWTENESGTSVHEQYRDAGIPVEKASTDKSGGIQLMQTLLAISPTLGKAHFEVMETCPLTAGQFESYGWKPQSTAMAEGGRWRTIDENDDLVTCARYYVQSDPVHRGTSQPRAQIVLSPTQRMMHGGPHGPRQISH